MRESTESRGVAWIAVGHHARHGFSVGPPAAKYQDSRWRHLAGSRAVWNIPYTVTVSRGFVENDVRKTPYQCPPIAVEYNRASLWIAQDGMQTSVYRAEKFLPQPWSWAFIPVVSPRYIVFDFRGRGSV